MNSRVKKILVVLVGVLTLIPLLGFYASADSDPFRMQCPGFPLGAAASNANERWGPSYYALGGVVVTNYSGSRSNTDFLSGITLQSVTNAFPGIQYYFHFDELVAGESFDFIIPIKCSDLTRYTWTGPNETAHGVTGATTFSDTVTARNNYTSFFPPGQAFSGDNQTGRFMVKLPDTRVNYYCVVHITVNESQTDTIIKPYFKCVSPADSLIDGNYSSLLTSLHSVINDEGVTTVGGYILSFTSMEWVLALIAVSLFLAFIGLLWNFLMSL